VAASVRPRQPLPGPEVFAHRTFSDCCLLCLFVFDMVLVSQTGYHSQSGRGAVVAISSTAHRFGTYLAAYGAEKAKLNSLMSSLSQELHGTGVTAQSMVIGPVLTRAVAELWAPAPAAAASSTDPNTLAASAEDAAMAALARCKPTVLTPAADTVGRAVVRAVGCGGPVVTPYWGHAVADYLLMDVLWPPSLQRAACRAISRSVSAPRSFLMVCSSMRLCLSLAARVVGPHRAH